MSKQKAQGKGKTSRPKKQDLQTFDAVVGVGTAITFSPTGEQLRVTKIEGKKITFEKSP